MQTYTQASIIYFAESRFLSLQPLQFFVLILPSLEIYVRVYIYFVRLYFSHSAFFSLQRRKLSRNKMTLRTGKEAILPNHVALRGVAANKMAFVKRKRKKKTLRWVISNFCCKFHTLRSTLSPPSLASHPS